MASPVIAATPKLRQEDRQVWGQSRQLSETISKLKLKKWKTWGRRPAAAQHLPTMYKALVLFHYREKKSLNSNYQEQIWYRDYGRSCLQHYVDMHYSWYHYYLANFLHPRINTPQCCDQKKTHIKYFLPLLFCQSRKSTSHKTLLSRDQGSPRVTLLIVTGAKKENRPLKAQQKLKNTDQKN